MIGIIRMNYREGGIRTHNITNLATYLAITYRLDLLIISLGNSKSISFSIPLSLPIKNDSNYCNSENTSHRSRHCCSNLVVTSVLKILIRKLKRVLGVHPKLQHFIATLHQGDRLKTNLS